MTTGKEHDSEKARRIAGITPFYAAVDRRPRSPHKSASCGKEVSSLQAIVRFRCGPPACSPPWLTRPKTILHLAYDGFLLPSSLIQGHPGTSGICYGAKLRIAPAGLPPASSTARFAARKRLLNPNTVALRTFWDDFRRPAVFQARHRAALAEGESAHLLPDATGLGLATAGDDALLEDLGYHHGRPVLRGESRRD